MGRVAARSPPANAHRRIGLPKLRQTVIIANKLCSIPDTIGVTQPKAWDARPITGALWPPVP